MTITVGHRAIENGHRRLKGKTIVTEDHRERVYPARIRRDECPNLTPELIKEIKSYQPIVDEIVAAAVNGKYSGDTWQA